MKAALFVASSDVVKIFISRQCVRYNRLKAEARPIVAAADWSHGSANALKTGVLRNALPACLNALPIAVNVDLESCLLNTH